MLLLILRAFFKVFAKILKQPEGALYRQTTTVLCLEAISTARVFQCDFLLRVVLFRAVPCTFCLQILIFLCVCIISFLLYCSLRLLLFCRFFAIQCSITHATLYSVLFKIWLKWSVLFLIDCTF